MKGTFITIIIFSFLSSLAFGQGELDDEKSIFFRDEKSLAFSIKNNGWGFDYRKGKHLTGFKKRILQFDFYVVKHPQEYKMTNVWYGGTSKYVYGKSNTCYDIRGAWGRQIELFSKFDKGSVEIRYLYLMGASIAILKPIYYEIITNGSTVNKKMDPQLIQPHEIYGKASYFLGIDETKVIPGVFTSFIASFEFGKRNTKLRAAEGGITLMAYPQKIEIMANDNNSQFFVILFLSYRFGKIYHGRHMKVLNEQNENNQ